MISTPPLSMKTIANDGQSFMVEVESRATIELTIALVRPAHRRI